MIAVSDIAAVISPGRFDLSNEKATQADIDTLLVAAFGREAVLREHRLSPGDVPDFVIGGVVVEVKIKGQRKVGIWKQLKRYAAHEAVTDLILVTNVSMGLPREIEGKPAYYLSLGRAWL